MTDIKNNINEPQSIFQEKESKTGPLIGSLIVVIIIVVGGLYLLSTMIDQKKVQIKKDETTKQEMVEEVDTVVEELEGINIDELDKDLNDLDKEFESL